MMTKLFRGLSFLAIAFFVLMALVGPFGALTNLRIPFLAILLVLLAEKLSGRKECLALIRNALCSRYFVWLFTLFAAVVFARIKILQWEAGQISGVDFSHIDYAIWSTVHGRFMQIPVIPPNQAFTDFFGNHYSPVLFFHVAARALVDSPLSSLVVHGVSLAAAIPALYFAAKDKADSLTTALLVLVYFFCGSVASTLQFDIHQESFYPLAYGLIFLGLTRGWGWIFAGTLLALSVKEDAGLYLAPFFVLASWKVKRCRWGLLAGAVASFVCFIFALKVAMPWHQPKDLKAFYYLPMWAKYGANFKEVAMGMASHPHWVLMDLFGNISLYKNLLPWGLLPFFSFYGLGALAPAVVSATASGPQHHFGLYYGVVLVPFFFYAASDVLGRQKESRRLWIAVVMLTLSSQVGGSYLRLYPTSPNLAAWLGTNQQVVAQSHSEESEVWAQSGILPYLPYSGRWKRIDDWQAIPAAITVVEAVDLEGGMSGTSLEDRARILKEKGYRVVSENGPVRIYRQINAPASEGSKNQ